jgi:PAS domain S-box-containing protein
LVFGSSLGQVVGPERWLVGSCVFFTAVLLITLLSFPRMDVSRVAPFIVAYFAIYLAAGTLLNSGAAGKQESMLVYLFWFFPLAAFNRFVNQPPYMQWAAAVISSVPFLLVAFDIGLGSLDYEMVAVLIVYSLVYACFLLVLRLFSRYREALVHERGRTEALEQARATVARSERRLQTIIDAAGSAIGWIGTDGVIRYANDEFRSLVGANPTGQPFAELVADDERDHWKAVFDNVRNGQARTEKFETSIIAHSGQELTVLASLSTVAGIDSDDAALIFVCQDVTQTRQLELRLRQTQRMEALGQLTGGIAHDFNNLLTVVAGNAEDLEEKLSDNQDVARQAAMIRLAAERGAILVKQLLSYARRQTLDPRPTNTNQLIHGMGEMLERTLGEDIELSFVPGKHVSSALVDPTQLESAVLNLAINSKQAMPNGGRLSIKTADTVLDEDYVTLHPDVQAGPYVSIAISDTGTGMDRETLSRVFEPFFTTRETGGGSGLGLSMVYGFIKQSRGHIRVYSEVGIGTTVRLYLPTAQAQSERNSQERPPLPVPSGDETLLVVEDDELVRGHVVAQLERLGYNVIPARDGAEALKVLGGDIRVDLLFTDMVMPGGVSGRDLAEQARALRPNLPVLYTSGYSQEVVDQHNGLERNTNLLEKPYRITDLAQRIRQTLAEGSRD